MGVADITWDQAMIEAALFRSAGVPLDQYAFGPALPPDAAAGFRKYKNQGSGVGHVYIHVAGTGDAIVGQNAGLAKKSRYVDRSTTLSVIEEILNSAGGKAGLAQLDANPGAQVWLKGAQAIPITGAWYGLAPGEATPRKILTASINMRSHGLALFISSSYPETLQALPVPPVAPIVATP